MRAGFGEIEITPTRPMPLSGFAARCEKPFEAVDDPLFVRALAVEDAGRTTLILAYDLLAIGRELYAEILAAVESVANASNRVVDVLLCTTHNHSAPAAITLLGCGEPQRDYWDQLIRASQAAARAALGSLQPARLACTSVDLPGHSYNRRRLLEDGRVVMAQRPDAPIRKVGPKLDRMLLLRLQGESGRDIAGIVSWAVHPDTVCMLRVTGDYPGELCRRLKEQYGFPFLFLQGASGNINPNFEEQTRRQMLANVDAILRDLGTIRWPEAVPASASALVRRSVPLSYGARFPEASLREMRDGMAAIAKTGDGPPDAMRMLANVLNIKPGCAVPKDTARHFASILRRWAQNQLEQSRRTPASCDLALAAWRLGPVAWCFVAAETFVETALSVAAAFPDRTVQVVGYSSPLVGYLPTDEALDEGGYEAAQAYIFYNHPAPFAKGSEPLVVNSLQNMLRTLTREN